MNEIIILVILLIVIIGSNYFRYKHQKNDVIIYDGEEMHESGLINKPRVIVLKGISNMAELREEVLPVDCDEDTYGPYQLVIDGTEATITLQGRVNLKDTVSLLTSLYLDLDDTHVENPSDRIKCYYPIAKIDFGESVIANTDAVIYPVGKPDDLVVHICTRDDKVYKYMEVTETMEELI